mmetsp:Transcript_6567/g.9640  ORF Transcript_6567/g.9640 Transcript_6567/m.9640 type:complete len:168 (+) Transcript_6567:83-586(+)|eukprot:CAMPEP_0194198854 /NCGR_PEP_ID=MMETSP0156-20130528/85_1 /TAXON_ID=33649 /ORGANISM="Thalassionema nitzschioides, Strain L26-B" /LENGTH=167 /DNA_ID=CAMNT_0038923683 /DNA_START=83 /DNA_END=586 /DNA_ORIENTATION=+
MSVLTSTTLTIFFLFTISNAFTIPSSFPKPQILTTSRSIPVSSQSDESSEVSAMNTSNGDNEKTLNESMHQEWIEQLQSSEIQEVRQEMVAKYVSFGKTIEDAEKEVDKFLSDPEQSLQYLEMREYAKSQELMGANAESLMFLVGAFLLGVCGSAAIKYFDLGKGFF